LVGGSVLDEWFGVSELDGLVGGLYWMG